MNKRNQPEKKRRKFSLLIMKEQLICRREENFSKNDAETIRQFFRLVIASSDITLHDEHGRRSAFYGTTAEEMNASFGEIFPSGSSNDVFAIFSVMGVPVHFVRSPSAPSLFLLPWNQERYQSVRCVRKKRSSDVIGCVDTRGSFFIGKETLRFRKPFAQVKCCEMTFISHACEHDRSFWLIRVQQWHEVQRVRH